MFLRFLPGLLARDFEELLICYPASNTRLGERLEAFADPRIRLKPWGYAKGRGEPYLAGMRLGYRNAIRRLFAHERPDRVLMLQGRIENLAVPMLALPPEAFVISYIPMAHALSEMGRNGSIGDAVRRRLYRRPNRFVVPSQAVAVQIALAGGGEAVVVENVVTPPPKPQMEAARATLDLPADRKIALYIGRLDSFQKGLDVLANALRRAAGRVDDWTFLFVGTGEGAGLIEKLAAETAGHLDIRHVGWTDRAHQYIAAADILLMPSRWEGVPLVMLEAMQYGTPLLTSDIDVFRDYLPPGNRIDFATADLATILPQRISPVARAEFAEAAAVRLAGNSSDRSTEIFTEALLT